jgi:hypothetical protein
LSCSGKRPAVPADAVVLRLDPSKRRRRPSARCVMPADRRRADLNAAIAALEEERCFIRDRLPHVTDGSALKRDLLLELCCIQADLERLVDELARDNVVQLRRAR